MKFGSGPCQICHSGDNQFWRNLAIPELRPECSGMVRRGWGRWQQPQWAQTTHLTCHLGLRWVFFLFSTYLLMGFHCIRIHIHFEGTKMDGEGGVDQNGPKWRIWHRLGHRWVFFFPLCVYYCYDFRWLRQSSTVVVSKVWSQMSLEECKSWTCIVLLGLRAKVEVERLSIKD